ncbi:MAG: phytanoyl-CoA dioxygenase family protein [Alphaproteobacteria bacterium]|nr:phytanoyl-CoA dioxygenase family protein [Alphaproteobacteria bacterium]
MVKPFQDSTSIAGDGKALAARMEAEGYLFVRGLLPRDEVLALRGQFLELAAKAGWLRADRPVAEGAADQGRACKDPEPAYIQHFKAMWKLEALHRMKHHPNLVGLFERMFGEPALVHPLLVARNIFPASNGFDFTTGRHQDRIHIGGGTSYAAWVPLGDCPMTKGGLTMVPGSHRAGVLPFRIAAGAGGLETEGTYDGEWVASDFRAGDVVIFSDTTVHKALPNRSGELRQSFDARYQRLSDPVAEVSIRTYANMFDWSEVYAGWKGSEDLRYYWIRQGARIVPFDTQYYERRDAIAFDLAERGDMLARDTLLRVAQRDPDAAKRTRAAGLLEKLDAAYAATARVA